MKNWEDKRVGFALSAVQTAASLAGRIQESLTGQALTKDDRSPVTVADFAAQAVVGYLLERSFPGALLVGEERADLLRSPEEHATLAQVTAFVNQVLPGLEAEGICQAIDRGNDSPGSDFWTLDPIDGTKGFLRRAQYACALAYIERGKVQIGVLGCPNITPDLAEEIGGPGALLVASRGMGSWIGPLRGDLNPAGFRPLAVSSCSRIEQARLMRSFESGHTNASQMDAFQHALGGNADPVLIDSQVKYALLASGKGEIYLRLLAEDRKDYREKIWDQAAGSIIVEEAGGKVSDLDGKDLDFSQGRTLFLNRGICASNGRLHGQALAALRTIQA